MYLISEVTIALKCNCIWRWWIYFKIIWSNTHYHVHMFYKNIHLSKFIVNQYSICLSVFKHADQMKCTKHVGTHACIWLFCLLLWPTGFTRRDLKLITVLFPCPPLAQLPKTPGLRPLTLEDVPAALNLLHTYFLESGLSPALSPQEAVHWLLPRKDVMDSYVVEVCPVAELKRNYMYVYEFMN